MKRLAVKEFTAVPYLQGSLLMQHHPEGVAFSEERPTVLVGPNGSGKSALLQALALRTLSYLSGRSCLDRHYLTGTDCREWWSQEHSWRREYTYLKGLECDTGGAPALYYRPQHIPGNEAQIVSAMMTGYMEQARAYAQAVDKRSSGQAAQALLEQLLSALQEGWRPKQLEQVNWSHGAGPKDPSKLSHPMPWDYQAEVLKQQVDLGSKLPTLVLMDEPEQSLDALAQLKLWQALERVNPAKVQVVVASHSLYPLLHPERFHLVETVPGYIESVYALQGAPALHAQ